MKYLFLSWLFLLATATGFSQAAFTAAGQVLDDSTKQPLAGASVFCQNTTLGTVTDNSGNFRLQLPAGGYDLIVSYTGYESQEIRINNTNADGLKVELKVKDKSLSEVIISGSSEVPDGLARYGRFFIDNFIGNTPNAAACTLVNPEVLQFYFSKKRNRLKIKGREDLVINNNALGYKIKYQLDSFTYDYSNDISTYSGYPFFEEMTGSPEDQEKWKINRLKAYKGSRLHFMRSWYDSTLAAQGFVLEWVDPVHKTITTFDIENPYDSAHYALVDHNDVEIDWKGSRLKVAYRAELPEKKYLEQYKLPLYLRGQITVLDIKDIFTIERNGYFYEQADVVNTGYWSWEKMAEAVPYDYLPQ